MGLYPIEVFDGGAFKAELGKDPAVISQPWNHVDFPHFCEINASWAKHKYACSVVIRRKQNIGDRPAKSTASDQQAQELMGIFIKLCLMGRKSIVP